VPGNQENEVGTVHRLYLLPDRSNLPGRQRRGPVLAGQLVCVHAWSDSASSPIKTRDEVPARTGAFTRTGSGHIRATARGLAPTFFNSYISGVQRRRPRKAVDRADLSGGPGGSGPSMIRRCSTRSPMSAHTQGAEKPRDSARMDSPTVRQLRRGPRVAGHETPFERTFPVKGVVPGSPCSRRLQRHRCREQLEPTAVLPIDS